MSDYRSCDVCGRAVSIAPATPYRTAAERDENPAPNLAPMESRRDAENAAWTWMAIAGPGWIAVVAFGAIWAATSDPWWGVAALNAALFSAGSACGYIRGLGAVRAWRDQERAKAGGEK